MVPDQGQTSNNIFFLGKCNGECCQPQPEYFEETASPKNKYKNNVDFLFYKTAVPFQSPLPTSRQGAILNIIPDKNVIILI